MSQWPDSMISTQRGSSPKVMPVSDLLALSLRSQSSLPQVSHTTAEGTLGHGQRPGARGPSVRERKVSLQAASASPHSSGDRKVSPSSTPVKQMVAAWGARGEREAAESDSNERPLSPKNGDGVKATATIQSDEAEVAAGLPSSAASTAPEASTSEAPADITTTLPRETGNYIQAQIEITPAPEDKQMSTEIPPQSAEAASASAIQPTSETKDTTVRKPQIDAQGTEVKADTSVLTGQLTEPEHKDPPLENEDATTKPAASSEASKSETAQAPNTPTQSNELDKIEAALSKLTPSESQKLQASLDKARSYPSHLPLTRPWCFYWSDTSGANSSKKNSSVKSYTSGMVDLFEADNVPLLCGALKAIKLRGRPQKGDLHLGDYGLHAGGQNIHVFRKVRASMPCTRVFCSCFILFTGCSPSLGRVRPFASTKLFAQLTMSLSVKSVVSKRWSNSGTCPTSYARGGV